MDNVRSMYEANPELMVKLVLDRQTVDIGNGLSVRIISIRPLGRDSHAIEFGFELEGRDIGSLDHEFGGWIEGLDTGNDKLFEAVSHRFIELFRSHAEKVLILPESY